MKKLRADEIEGMLSAIQPRILRVTASCLKILRLKYA
jgi:hypothetical protein